MKIWDISPAVSEKAAVFPGDLPFSREVLLDMGHGDHLTLSGLRTTVHIGAHVDAHSHYDAKGATIDERDLHLYMGECQVIEARGKPAQRLLPSDVDLKRITKKRVLFKTLSFPNPERWQNEFTSLSPELVSALAENGVKLVGIDTPSIDPWDSKALESHAAIRRHDLAILEGIVLNAVAEGFYTLLALPLRLKGLDASPVRAILLEEGGRIHG